MWNVKNKNVDSKELGSVSWFERSLASVTRKVGDCLEWNYIRFISPRSSLQPKESARSDKKKIILFFNDIVAKQWPRPIKFVPKSCFKVNASVSRVKHCTGNILLISILGNRYCLNIKREHKNNGIYFVVNEEKNLYFQKCYDHSCKGFKSKNLLLKTKFGIKRRK